MKTARSASKLLKRILGPQATRRKRSLISSFEQLEDRRLLAVFENFDGVVAPNLPANWAQTTSTNAWSTVATGSHSSPNHAFVANVDTTSDSILTSPSFVLSPTTPLLSFRNSYDTEQDWDGGVLEISVNGGAFADILAAGGSFVTGGYVSGLSNSSNPLAGRQAWHGDSGGYISTTVNLPVSAFNQNVALRWRMGSDSSVNEVGWRIDSVTLDSIPTHDFGDAPIGYPVTLAENGARHAASTLFLGTQVDLDSDGVHSADALGDGPDDDGVVFQGGFALGQSESIEVIASQAGGLLNAWVDWNADGDWSDSGEQIFTNQALAAGVNSLVVSVPGGAALGNTFGRFRLSTASNLSVTGSAADGEVEDYRIAVTAGLWSPLGPFGATNGQVEGIANRPVTGAIHTILAHPTDANIVYIGGTNGGVWKTTNATAASPNWTPLTDSLPSQSIGALTFDLGDPTFNTIYAGNGQYSSFARIGNERRGLMRTTDGGQTWQVVDGGGVLRGKNISGIHANGNTVVVSVNVADNFSFNNIGIFRSTDGGVSFSQVSVSNGATTGLPGGVSYDLVTDPVTPTTLYTSTVFSDLVGAVNGIFKSTNSGATWTRVSTPAIQTLITNNTSNLELAVGRSNEVYAAIINAGAFAGLFRSPNGGNTWVQMDSPSTNENGTDVGLNPSGGKGPTSGAPEGIAGGQGAIHFAIVADPNNANLVYVGGDRQPRSNGDTGSFPNSIGANDFTGRLFRGDASQPAGSQFVHLTHRNNLGAAGGGTASNSSPHADSREMAFDVNGNLLEVDDGGVYRRTSPQNNTGDWFSMIGDLQMTEAHDVAWDSLSNVAFTGNQDTGTTYQPFENAAEWVSLSTADGGDVAVDNIQLAGSNQSVRYTSFQNLGGFRQTVWNSSGGLVSTSFPALTPINGSAALVGAFRTPLETNSVAGGRLLIQGANGLYESLNSGATITAIGTTLGANSVSANAISYGGTKNNVANPDLVWAARGSDVFVRTAGTGSVVATASDPTTAEIRDLAVNSRDWANAFVIDNNQVFSTTNVGANWSDITGNLLSLASQLWSVAYVTSAVTDAVLVGTNAGVFAAATSALTTWVDLGTGLPNIITYDMEVDATDDVLVVGTLGRGAWKLDDISSVIADLFQTGSFTVTETNGDTSVAENGTAAATTDTFSIVLDSQPSSDVVFNVASGDTGEATVSPSTVTFTNANWNVPQVVTVNGVIDNIADGNQNTLVTISVNDTLSDDAFDNLSDQTVNVLVIDVAEELELDTEGAGVALSPGWGASASVPGFEGANYRFARGGTNATATFTPILGQDGLYEVFASQTAHINRASNAQVRVAHNNGVTVLTKDQRTGSGFQSLGMFNFSAGSQGQVIISAQGADGFVVADAVRFVRVGELAPVPSADLDSPADGSTVSIASINGIGIISVTFASQIGLNAATITDAAAEFTLSGPGAAGVTAVSGTGVLVSGTTYNYSFTGSFSQGLVNVHFVSGSFADTANNLNIAETESFMVSDGVVRIQLDNPDAVQFASWAVSGAIPGYVGTDYLYNPAGGAGRLTYTPLIDLEGQYEVFVNYTGGATRATNAAYEVNSQAGTTIARVNQQVGGGNFQSIGSFNFLAGNSGSVTLRADDANGIVVGDAVRFVRIGELTGAPSATLSDPAIGSTILITTINGRNYLDVTYTSHSAFGLDAATITDDAPEFTLSGPGAEDVVVSGAGELVVGTSTTYRYATSGSFSPGAVDAVFGSGSFADLSPVPITNIPSVASFIVTEAFSAEVIVDNTSPGFAVSDPTQFLTSSSVGGFIGTNYRAAPAGSTATATWTPTLPQSGTYDVYVRYTSHPLRATNATYVINRDGGTSTVVIDQTQNGGEWVLLGSFVLTNGLASVTLNTEGANQFVVADAVRFVLP